MTPGTSPAPRPPAALCWAAAAVLALATGHWLGADRRGVPAAELWTAAAPVSIHPALQPANRRNLRSSSAVQQSRSVGAPFVQHGSQTPLPATEWPTSATVCATAAFAAAAALAWALLRSLAAAAPSLASSQPLCPRPVSLFATSGPRRPSLTLHAATPPATASPPTPTEFAQFWQWAREKGLVGADAPFALARDAQGPVLKLTRDVAEGEVLFEVPAALWLTAERARREFNAPQGEADWIAIAISLLAAAAGHAPALAPYASTLPPATAAPATAVLLWPAEVQDRLLAGTQLLGSLQGYRAYVEAEAERLAVDPAALLWAFAAVRSRRRPPLAEGADLALVPLLDLLRQAPIGQAVAAVSRPGLFAPRPVRVTAARAAQAGEILTCDFDPEAPIGEGTLLLDYGQACVAYPQYAYTFQLSVPEDTKFRDDKLDVLDLAGLGEGPAFTVVAGEEPPPPLLAVLRLLALQGMDAFLLEAIFRQQVWGFCQQPVSAANEREMCDTMTRTAAAALRALPPSGFVWTKLDTREAVAAYAAAAEARALQWCVDWFGQRVTELKRLEYYQERRLKELNLLDEQGRSTYVEGEGTDRY
eukprot:EG_transcript_6853